MIPFDFEYFKPDSVEEAVRLFEELSLQGKKPTYYGGGTEIISFSRLYQLYPKAVIDLKGIPEGQVLENHQDKIIIGAAVNLSRIQEANIFPLLSWTGGRVADHTTRNKITLGGNLSARIPYREAVLPLLLAESELVIAGKDGVKRLPLKECFDQTIHLEPDEFILQVITEKKFTEKPFISLKKTSQGDVTYPQDRIGYPLISAAALKTDGQIRIAFSGLCSNPFRSTAMEAALNEKNLSPAARILLALERIPLPALGDMEASAEFRLFQAQNALAQIINYLEGTFE